LLPCKHCFSVVRACQFAFSVVRQSSGWLAIDFTVSSTNAWAMWALCHVGTVPCGPYGYVGYRTLGAPDLGCTRPWVYPALWVLDRTGTGPCVH
jgi:hypothetical protein